MTIGFIYNGFTTFITPDKGLTRTKTPKVLVAEFGDGYEQRRADGINNIKEELSLSFVNRTKEVIDDVCVFLDATKGVTKFSLFVPDSNAGSGEKEIKVRFKNYSIVYTYGDFYNLTVGVVQVFET